MPGLFLKARLPPREARFHVESRPYVIASINFAFHLASATAFYQSSHFPAIRGNGMLTGNGFEDRPATWWFTTQGVAADDKFNWSSGAVALVVPDGGTSIILLGGSLLGLHGLRRHF